MMIACRVCKEEKPEKEFQFRKDNNRYRTECLNCQRKLHAEYRERPGQREIAAARSRKWTAENKEHAKDYVLNKTYGISLNDYNRLFKEQDGCCAICFRHGSTVRRSLFVDHCHNSKKVRGLLCYTCNLGLGQFKDSLADLESAIAYLKKHSD